MEIIVLGIIIHKGKILVGSLRSHVRSDFAGVSSVLPGGKASAEDSLQESVKKKILKETGLEVVVKEQVGERMHPLFCDKKMVYFHCETDSENLFMPENQDIESFAWEEPYVAARRMLTLYSKVFSFILRYLFGRTLPKQQDLPKLSWLSQSMNSFGKKIRAGELVAFPTETVYGLGANAYDAAAVAAIFSTKGRPADNPLIVHVASAKKLDSIAANLSPLAEKLYRVFSPGPLTVILPKRKDIPDIVTAHLPLVGVRIPNHGLALEFLAAANVPVAAPSANLSGKPSPTHHSHVKRAFKDAVPNIIKAGTSLYGVESTVVKVINEEKIAILRQGAISKESIQKEFPTIDVVFAGQDNDSIKVSPGTRFKHYAPKAKITIVPASSNVEMSTSISALLIENTGKVAVAAADEIIELLNLSSKVRLFSLGSIASPDEAVKNLYSILLSCDQKGIEELIIHGYPEVGLGRTFMERISRAAVR